MIEIVPFKPEHLELFEGKKGDELMPPGLDYQTLFTVFADRGAMFSGIVDDRVVAIAGLIGLWDGVGEVFATFTEEGTHYMKSIHRKSKEVIETALKDGFWRIQTNVKAGFEKGIRWVEGLGFHSEGPMERYAPDGSNMIRYSIVRRD